MRQGYTGISFPFRIGVKGGVVTSTTNMREVPHIIEAMEQILSTRPLERCMEYSFKSDLDTDIFEPNDSSSRTLVAYQVEEALKELEDRIEITSVDVYSEESSIYATINFIVLTYDTPFTTTLKVGDINVQNTNTRDRLY